MNISSEHFCRSLFSFNHNVFYHTRVKISHLGRHCLFLHKAGCRKWRHKNWFSHECQTLVTTSESATPLSVAGPGGHSLTFQQVFLLRSKHYRYLHQDCKETNQWAGTVEDIWKTYVFERGFQKLFLDVSFRQTWYVSDNRHQRHHVK